MISKRGSTVLILLLVVALAMLVAGCGSSTTSGTAGSESTTGPGSSDSQTTSTGASGGEKVLKFGSSAPLTGGLAKEGNLVREGYEFWRDAINAKGGIKVGDDTYKVELILYDDKSDAATAAKLTEKLITEDKVNFLLSPYSSGLTVSTSAIAEKYKMVNVAPLANATKIYNHGLQYVFSILWPSSIDVSNLVEMLPAENITVNKIAIVYPDDLFPAAGAQGAMETAKELNIPTVEIKYPKGIKDLSGVVADIKKSEAEAVISTAFFEDATIILRQMNEQGIKPNFVAFHDAINLQPDFVNSVGANLAEGISGRAEFWPLEEFEDELFGTGVQFAEAIEAKFGHPHSYHQAAAAAAGYVMGKAIEMAGSLDNEKIREVLLSNSFDCFFGPIEFGQMKWLNEDLTNVNTKGKPISVQIQEGELVVVYPDDVATAKFEYPKPW